MGSDADIGTSRTRGNALRGGVGLVDQISLRNNSSGRFVTRPFAPSVNLDVAIITSKSRPVSDTGQAFLSQLEVHLGASCKSIKARE